MILPALDAIWVFCKRPVLPPHLSSVHICWGLRIWLCQHWHDCKMKHNLILILSQSDSRVPDRRIFSMLWTGLHRSLLLSYPRGSAPGGWRMLIHTWKCLDSWCKNRSRGETYPAISVDIGVEEIRFEPKRGVQDLRNGQIWFSNLLHFWRVEGIVLRKAELCDKNPIFKVGALVEFDIWTVSHSKN